MSYPDTINQTSPHILDLSTHTQYTTLTWKSSPNVLPRHYQLNSSTHLEPIYTYKVHNLQVKIWSKCPTPTLSTELVHTSWAYLHIQSTQPSSQNLILMSYPDIINQTSPHILSLSTNTKYPTFKWKFGPTIPNHDPHGSKGLNSSP